MTKKEHAEPPRPRCSACGKPGVYFVVLEIKEMKLSRDAGVTTRPYWTADYHSGCKLDSVLCADCKQGSVSISTSVSATLANAKERAP